MSRPEIQLWAVGQKARLRLPLGDGPATITGGHGGWEVLGRPGKVGSTRYAGTAPLQQDIPILLDGFAGDRSVQGQVNRLIELSRPQGGKRPPRVKVAGPVHRTSLVWVIEDIQWGGALRRPGVGLVRQELTLQLLQFVRSDRIGQRARPRATSEWGHRVVTVKRGDTWRRLAVEYLRDASKWKQIAELNDKKPNDPNVKLKPGRRVRVS